MATGAWQWQIRDAKGKWIEMGSTVTYMQAGRSISAKVVGSPKPGYVTIEGPGGKRTTIASSRVTVAAPAPGEKKGAEAKATPRKQVKAVVPGGLGPVLHMSPTKQAEVRAQQRAERERKATGKAAVGANRGAPVSSTNDGGRQDKPEDKRLNGIHSTSSQIERMLRIKAKEQGISDPFGDKEAAKKKTAAAKAKEKKAEDAQKSPEEKAAEEKEAAKKKPRKDTRKKLTQSQIDAVSKILKAVLVSVKEGKFSNAMSALKRAEGLLKDTSAPWLSKRISWLKKGVANFSLTAAAVRHVRTPEGQDKYGQPIGSVIVRDRVKYVKTVTQQGKKVRKAALGTVVGFTKQGHPIVQNVLSGKKDTVAPENVTKLNLTDLVEQTQKFGGASVKIDGKTPSDGFMVAQLRGRKIVRPASKFFGGGGAKELFDFMRDNAEQFDTDPNAYIGLWYDVDHDEVAIDVSHNVASEADARLFGEYQDQQSIWDVVNEVEIQIGGTGGRDVQEGVRPPGSEDLGDDGRGTDGVVRAGSRRPPPVGGSRPVEARSSLAALDPVDYEFVNNGGGTLTDPVHVKEYDATEPKTNKKTGYVSPATPARSLTVRQSDLAAHIQKVVDAALTHNAKANVKASEAAIAKARRWYVDAHEECIRIQKDFNRQYPGANLTLEQVTGVMAAVSPRQRWEQNITSCEKVIAAYLAKDDLKSLDELKDETGAGLRGNVEMALKILDGADPSVMTGLKRKSFWNCLMDPENTYDTTIDGWMASSIWRMGGKFSDGTPVDETAQQWVDHSRTRDGEVVVEGAGYVILADAVRDVARELHLTPLEVQAIYWVAVGGGQRNTQMYSDEPRRTGPAVGFNTKGKPALTQTGITFDYPYSKPIGDVRYFRYAYFHIIQSPEPGFHGRGAWEVRDPFDVNAKAGLGVQKWFKTKKAALDYMKSKVEEGLARPDYDPTRPGEWDGTISKNPPMVAAGGTDMIPILDKDGGEWCTPDDYDAVAIADMADLFRATNSRVASFNSAWEITGPHPTAGQIQYCWENPDAWEILEQDVDRQWFMEQVATRTANL
jgi:hypothetical protein